MPNIIEQQDLLKGLTDQRLSALMQQPTGDIPPFLVAAEAQRRQAIRAQFGNNPQNNESVVDTLAKQMGGVPEDVNANPAPPPTPPAQQAGIAGIQQPSMAGGGPVRRFASLGYVEPTDYSYYQDPLAIPYVPPTDFDPFTPVGNAIGNAILKFEKSPIPQWEENARNAKSKPSTYTPEENIRELAVQAQRLAPRVNTQATRNPNTGTDDTSNENKYKAQSEDFRKRYEELVSDGGPSSWDRAQKWFAVSQGLLDPNATTGELIAGAINNFGQGMAQEKRMERQAARDQAEAMLKYDMGVAEDDRAAAAAGMKAKTDIATGQLDDLYRQMSEAQREMRSIQTSVDKGEITPDVAEARKQEISDSITTIGQKIASYEGYLQDQYGFGLIESVNTGAGTVNKPGR